MNTVLFDTQKVRLDLMKELLEVEQSAIQATDGETDVAVLAELGGKIRWLKGKLAFYTNGWHKVYKQQN